MQRGTSIRAPLAATLALGVLGVSIAAAFVIGDLYETAIEAAGADSMRVTQAMFGALERSDVKKMDAALEALLGDEELLRHFRDRDLEGLLAAALPRFRGLRDRDGITHWYFITPERTTFLRVHKPELRGDRVDRVTLERAAETGGMASGLELGQTAFALRVVRPWYVGGALVGYMELAEEIDHFLVRMKGETGNDFGVLVKKRFLDEEAFRRVAGGVRDTWNARPDVVVVDTTSFTDGLIDYEGDLDAVPPGGLVLGEETDGGRAWIRAIYPIVDATGRRVGALFVARDFTSMHGAMERGRIRVLLVVLAMSFCASVVIWLALEWFALRRVRQAVAEIEAAAGMSGPEPGVVDELHRLDRLRRRLKAGRDLGPEAGP